jgi:radical SAM protein (TIGR01212 family)
MDWKTKYGGKRFNSYSTYLQRKYGERIQKVTVDAGFTCPNRDGTVASGGCIYCNNESFNPGYNSAAKSITQQIAEGIEFLKRRYKSRKYIVYFQPYSNTYASLDRLRLLYEEALTHPEVIGLTIGTRPDCIDEQKITYLAELAREYDITIEYGLETIKDDSLKKINRGHDYQAYLDALKITAGRGLKICTHIIIGFPWENEHDWLQEALILSELPTDFLKIHQLHIVKDTAMAEQYEKKVFQLLTFDQYISILITFIERLNPDIIIQRLFGEAPPHTLIAPRWGKRNSEALQKIEQELIRRDTWQGRLYEKPNR